MKKKKMRSGIVGAGFAASFHFESLKRIYGTEVEVSGVYSIQKEREIIEKTGAQILWMHGEEAHSGSHASTHGHWKYSGGGAMVGKGCHPLTAALYLKRGGFDYDRKACHL